MAFQHRVEISYADENVIDLRSGSSPNAECPAEGRVFNNLETTRHLHQYRSVGLDDTLEAFPRHKF